MRNSTSINGRPCGLTPYTSMSCLAFSSLNLCEACQHLFVFGVIHSLDTKINLLDASDLLSSAQASGVVMWAAWIVFSVVVLLSAPPPENWLPSLLMHTRALPSWQSSSSPTRTPWKLCFPGPKHAQTVRHYRGCCSTFTAENYKAPLKNVKGKET